MAKECPNCGTEHEHSELELTDTWSTFDTTYAYLKCPSCGEESDYSEWGFHALYD